MTLTENSTGRIITGETGLAHARTSGCQQFYPQMPTSIAVVRDDPFRKATRRQDAMLWHREGRRHLAVAKSGALGCSNSIGVWRERLSRGRLKSEARGIPVDRTWREGLPIVDDESCDFFCSEGRGVSLCSGDLRRVLASAVRWRPGAGMRPKRRWGKDHERSIRNADAG